MRVLIFIVSSLYQHNINIIGVYTISHRERKEVMTERTSTIESAPKAKAFKACALVEMTGIEPVSENQSARLSTGVVCH